MHLAHIRNPVSSKYGKHTRYRYPSLEGSGHFHQHHLTSGSVMASNRFSHLCMLRPRRHSFVLSLRASVYFITTIYPKCAIYSRGPSPHLHLRRAQQAPTPPPSPLRAASPHRCIRSATTGTAATTGAIGAATIAAEAVEASSPMINALPSFHRSVSDRREA